MAEPETMVFRFHSGQSLRASIEHEAPLYYSLRDTAGNPLIVSRDRVREIVPLAGIEPCPQAFSGATTDPGHRWIGEDGHQVCASCDKPRPASPASSPAPGSTTEDEQAAEVDRLRKELAKYVGHEPTIAEEMQYLGRCLDAVQDVCDEAEKQATRWEHPLPVPEWVATVREAANGERPDNPDDNRRRIYVDGKGNGWIDQSVTSDGTRWVVPVNATGPAEETGSAAERTGSLREIGRCW